MHANPLAVILLFPSLVETNIPGSITPAHIVDMARWEQ